MKKKEQFLARFPQLTDIFAAFFFACLDTSKF